MDELFLNVFKQRHMMCKKLTLKMKTKLTTVSCNLAQAPLLEHREWTVQPLSNATCYTCLYYSFPVLCPYVRNLFSAGF